MKDLQEALSFFIKFFNVVGEAFEDGKLSFGDLGLLVTDMPELIAKGSAAWEGHENIKVAFLQVPEFREALVKQFKEEFDLADDMAEGDAEKAVEGLMLLYGVIASRIK